MNERTYKTETLDRARMLRERFDPPWNLITENDYSLQRDCGMVDIPLRVTIKEWLYTFCTYRSYVRTRHFVAVAFHEYCGCTQGNGYCAFAEVMVRQESRVHSFSNHRNDGEALAKKVAAFLVKQGSLEILDG